MDYDKFGHCVKCHKNMITEQYIDGQITQRFTPEYSEEELFLDNNSKMRVAICKTCQDNLSDIDFPAIMDSVVNGWDKELKDNNWDNARKQKYKEDFFNVKIITRSNGKTPDELKNHLKQFKEKKDK